MDPQSRAAWRRAHWTGGVAKSFSELEDVDVEWWLTQTPEDRIGLVFDMWDEQRSLEDPTHEATSRLPRAVGGVRPRRG
jgi:hypothetical protein